jgi:hypothetical protein
MLTRDQIFQIDDLQQEVVAVPEWGGDVIVRGMTGAERDEYEGARVQIEGKRVRLNYDNISAKLVSLCVIDEHGARLFSEADVAQLGTRNGKALKRVAEVCTRLSGLRDEDGDAASKNS